MANIETYIVDSFTDKPFKGNPAGVCLLSQKMSDDKMLLIAQELGFSETAFVSIPKGAKTCNIRFFSPKMEIPLCGHATLAASKVIFENDLSISNIHFVNIQNLDLFISRENECIRMEFPSYETEYQEAPSKLLAALGIKEINNSVFNKETRILLLEISDNTLLAELKPNFEKLLASHDSINGVLVTSLSSKADYDFESRYFWPWSGTNEDPVTGGTHTFLAKYWGRRLNKKKMTSFQCSERSGFMEVELIDDHKISIRSTAQIVLKGVLKI